MELVIVCLLLLVVWLGSWSFQFRGSRWLYLSFTVLWVLCLFAAVLEGVDGDGMFRIVLPGALLAAIWIGWTDSRFRARRKRLLPRGE